MSNLTRRQFVSRVGAVTGGLILAGKPNKAAWPDHPVKTRGLINPAFKSEWDDVDIVENPYLAEDYKKVLLRRRIGARSNTKGESDILGRQLMEDLRYAYSTLGEKKR